MKGPVLMLTLLLYFLSASFAFGSGLDHQPTISQNNHSGNENSDTSEKGWFDTETWQFIKGKPAVDALHLGMWSLHLDGTGEFFGNGKNNDHNHLIGFQYRGFNAGTFINSHDQRTYTIGLSRQVFAKHYSPDLRFDAGYRLGLLYGYEKNLKNIMGISGYAMPVFGLTWKRVGVDLGVVPVGVLTLNFRIDIDRRSN